MRAIAVPLARSQIFRCAIADEIASLYLEVGQRMITLSKNSIAVASSGRLARHGDCCVLEIAYFATDY